MKNKLIYGGMSLLIIGILFISCQNNKTKKDKTSEEKQQISSLTDFSEQFRPQFHFTPQEKWMNDPNGLVYYKGVYHLFFQYYPEDIVWGPMHWGHATSKDLISWEHKPIALFPDELGYIFSGSAVIDHKNSSGFGSSENPAMVAIFTYHLIEGERAGRDDFQTQGIAYSLDEGKTWQKYKGNPVIKNTGIKDFRDPKVFWHEQSQQWIMILVAGDHAKFYKSKDLKNWNFMSDFGKDQGAHGGVWECPDLFKLKVEGTDQEKWVLLISINPGAPNGGSGTQYFVGQFDGEEFKADHKDIKWIDYGADNYAGITYNNTLNNERIFIGWMSNWNYARNTPTEKWRSAMTLPRNFSLDQQNGAYYLKSEVVEAFDSYKSLIQSQDLIDLSEAFKLENKSLNQVEISFTANLKDQLELSLKNDIDEKLVIKISSDKSEISIDRRQSGLVNFEERFAKELHKMNYQVLDKEVDINIIVDWSSIEIFIDKGRYVLTEQIFPTSPYTTLDISSSSNTTVKNFNLNQIKSIW